MVRRVVSSSMSKSRWNSLTVNAISPTGVGWVSRSAAVAMARKAWASMARVVQRCQERPLMVKGICHPDDARRAKDIGVDGIYCSNHGGRQANGGLPVLFDSKDLTPDTLRRVDYVDAHRHS